MARTLLIQKWSYHTARVREPKRVQYQPINVLGADVLNFVKGQLVSGANFDLEDKKRWVQVDAVDRCGTRSLLVVASAGAYGEEGRVVDRRDSSVQFQMEPDHAPTSSTRMLVVVPDSGNYAFALMERSTGRGSAGLDLVGQLHKTWREQYRDVTWHKEWIDDADAWRESGELKAVEVRRYRGFYDTAHGDEGGIFEYRARSRRGGVLSRGMLDAILEDSSKAHELIGIEAEEDDRVFLELRLDGRVAKYALDGGKLPKAQALLPDDLDNEAFTRHCAAEVQNRLCPKLGLIYNPGWIN